MAATNDIGQSRTGHVYEKMTETSKYSEYQGRHSLRLLQRELLYFRQEQAARALQEDLED